MPDYLQQSLAKLKEFEGCVPWMYRDTAGKVTVGVGLMLPDASAACALPFVMAGGPATQQQIAEEFARVDALEKGKVPGFYKAASSPELPGPVIDARLTSVLARFEQTLRTKLAGYDGLPEGVKLALLDMAYNLGPTGLLAGYPRLIHAVERGAWAQAAAECERHGIGAARNAWTSAQLLSAVVAAIRAEVGDEARSIERRSAGWLAEMWRRLRDLVREVR